MVRHSTSSPIGAAAFTLVAVLGIGCGRLGYEATARLDAAERSDASGPVAVDAAIADAAADDAAPPPKDSAGLPNDAMAAPDATADASMMEDGGSAGSCGAGAGGLLFCDDFESGDVSRWETVSGSPTATMGPPAPYRGTYALQTEYRSGTAGPYVDTTSFAVTSGIFAVRTHVYVPSSTSINLMDALSTGTARSPFQGLYVGLTGSGLNLYSSIVDETWTAAPGVLPRDRWFCLRLEVDVSDASGRARLFVDGTAVIDRSPVDTLPTRGYEFLAVGLSFVEAPQSRLTVYYDEVAVGSGAGAVPCL